LGKPNPRAAIAADCYDLAEDLARTRVRAQRKPPPPELIPIKVVAKRVGMSSKTLINWIAKGDFPLPHSVFQKTRLYRTDDIDVFIRTGKWPAGARFARVRDRAAEPKVGGS